MRFEKKGFQKGFLVSIFQTPRIFAKNDQKVIKKCSFLGFVIKTKSERS